MMQPTWKLIASAAAMVALAACNGNDHDHENGHQDHIEQTTTVPPADTATTSEQVAYACPMHPEVTGKEGDSCPKCGMDLEKVE